MSTFKKSNKLKTAKPARLRVKLQNFVFVHLRKLHRLHTQTEYTAKKLQLLKKNLAKHGSLKLCYPGQNSPCDGINIVVVR